MKKLIAIVTVSAALVGFGEEDLGGELKIWPENHGVFVFVNAQSAIAEKRLAEPVDKLARDLNFDIRFVKGEAVDIRAVPEALTKLGAKGAVWIVNDAALPPTIAACDSDWGVLNVAPFLSDAPDAAKLDARLIRAINRIFAYIHGAYDPTMMPQCVMKPAIGVAGLDALVCRDYSPETFSKVTSYMTSLGYVGCRCGTYYDACEEGWAPKPTNDVQKAIWDKVHKLPTAPMTIKRESERN